MPALPILILNGPNLNMLGQREPEIYGTATLADMELQCRAVAGELGLAVECVQTNHIGKMIDLIQAARETHAGIVINAGGYSHSSVALLDALLVSELPVIEVHISNIHRREKFRRHSHVSLAATGVICGLGIDGYAYALRAMAKLVNGK